MLMRRRAVMQTHHLPARLPFGRKSEALWSLKPTGTALVFVHGFGGNAVTTWMQFPSLLQSEPRLSGHDLLFFGYDGLTTRAIPNADLLIRFLDALNDDPAGLANTSVASAKRTNTFKYEKIVLVGHSLGAVVSRQALIDAYRKKRSWPNKVRLVFFAPAHSGANIIALATMFLGGLALAPLAAIMNLGFKPLQDLKVDSTTLRVLAEQTRSAIEQGRRNLIAECIVHARNDAVVESAVFCEDPPAEFIDGKGHRTLCKPQQDFIEPLNYVVKHA